MKNIDVILLLLALSVLKAIITPDMSYAIITIALSGLCALKNYLGSKKTPDLSEEIMKQLKDMRSITSALSIKNARIPEMAKQEIVRKFF